MAKYVTSDGDVVDEVCWRHYGRQVGVVERVLEFNPGLADRGPVLPAGVEIELPVLPSDLTESKITRFWG